MTRTRKIILSSLAALVLLFAVINIFLFYGMTGMVKKILPGISQTTGVTIGMNKIWATLPRGIVKISGLSLDNAAGKDRSLVSAGHVRANLGFLSLLRGIITFSSLDIENAKMTIVRNKAEKSGTSPTGAMEQTVSSVNETAVTGNTSGQQSGTANAGAPAPDPAFLFRSELPRAALGRLRMNTVLEYIDPDGAKLRLNLEITAENISTYGDPNQETGNFSVKGHLENKPDSIVIDIKGRVAPVVSTENPTFDINGTITNIRTKDFKELADAVGIEIGQADINLDIKCREGSYSREASFVNADIKDLKASEKLASKVKGASLSSATLSIPLKGTFAAPDFDPVGSMIDTLAGNIEAITRSLKSNKKIEKEINRALESLLGEKKKK